jgi:transcriptional regulator with XRE-family HTH domain
LPLTTNFFAAALRREMGGRGLDSATIAKALGYKSPYFVQAWMNGRSLPTLPILVELAHAIATPLEDLLLPWLGDTDPKHVADFWIIADLLWAEDRANQVFGDDGGTQN